MAATKKTSLIDKAKDAITGFFTDDEAKPANKGGSTKHVATTVKTVTKEAAKRSAGGAERILKPSTRVAKAVKKAPATKTAAKKSAKSMDRKLIALSEPYEVRDWCKTLSCTEAELKAAVAVMGRSAAKVREHLKTKRGKSMDRKLIALSQPHEVRDWCKSLGCSEAELRAAVSAVGRSAAKVRAHLSK